MTIANRTSPVAEIFQSCVTRFIFASLKLLRGPLDSKVKGKSASTTSAESEVNAMFRKWMPFEYSPGVKMISHLTSSLLTRVSRPFTPHGLLLGQCVLVQLPFHEFVMSGLRWTTVIQVPSSAKEMKAITSASQKHVAGMRILRNFSSRALAHRISVLFS